MQKAVFLEAEWRKLILINYAVNKSVLSKYVPAYTELDEWNGNCYVSVVGFMFLNTKVKGIKIPFHVNFEELNLRFYVKHKKNEIYKRGAVFIKEIVPKHAITAVANFFYNEKYQTFPTKHEWKEDSENFEISYGFNKKKWHSIKVIAGKEKHLIEKGSEAEFITEHYWGYTQINASKTKEYGVEHPRWDMYPIKSYSLDIDFTEVYGNEFSFLNAQTPTSVILAEGSEIIVRTGRTLVDLQN